MFGCCISPGCGGCGIRPGIMPERRRDVQIRLLGRIAAVCIVYPIIDTLRARLMFSALAWTLVGLPLCRWPGLDCLNLPEQLGRGLQGRGDRRRRSVFAYLEVVVLLADIRHDTGSRLSRSLHLGLMAPLMGGKHLPRMAHRR